MHLILSPFHCCSPHTVPNVCEYKDTRCGGKHHTHVSENSSKVDQASRSHQQEKQGTQINVSLSYSKTKVNDRRFLLGLNKTKTELVFVYSCL